MSPGWPDAWLGTDQGKQDPAGSSLAFYCCSNAGSPWETPWWKSLSFVATRRGGEAQPPVPWYWQWGVLLQSPQPRLGTERVGEISWRKSSVSAFLFQGSCAARQRVLLNSCLSNWSPFSSLFRLFPGFVEQVRKSPLWCFPKLVRRIVHSKHEGLQGLVQWATPLLQGLQHQLGRGPQWVLDTLVGAALQADEPPVPYHGWVSRLHGETRGAAQTLWGSSQGPEGEGNPSLHRSTFLRAGLSCGQRRGQKGLSGMSGFFLLLHPQFGWSQSTTFGQGQEDLFAIKFLLQGKQIFLSSVKQTAWG